MVHTRTIFRRHEAMPRRRTHDMPRYLRNVRDQIATHERSVGAVVGGLPRPFAYAFRAGLPSGSGLP
jgi:hypothetical protein